MVDPPRVTRPACDQRQHLPLAIGELVESGRRHGVRRPVTEKGLDQAPGDGRRKE
ncbi:MAG TPA: hypothetical protein VII87_11900 [Solirubrobacteraceae bacterium]